MNTEVKTYLFQRKMLGILCALLAPLSLLLGLFGAESNLEGWYMSISATYYASSKICMIGLLFTTAVFFLSYTGYDWRDRVLSIIQAVASLGIIVFPCRTPGIPDTVGLFNLPVATSALLHNISAIVLFIAFAVNILCLFTLGDSGTPQKALRNRIYRICGTVILVFCVIQALSATTSIFSWVPNWFPKTWFNEFMMLEAFAVAWIVKSEAIAMLNDDEEQPAKS